MILTTLASPADAYQIDLREEDRAEALLYGRGGPEEALADTISRAQLAFTTRDPQGHILAIWGRSYSELGCHPWLMCSKASKGHGRALLRIGRMFVGQCLVHGAPVVPVCNFVSKDATAARAFIRRLGFTIVDRPGPFDLFYFPSCALTQ